MLAAHRRTRSDRPDPDGCPIDRASPCVERCCRGRTGVRLENSALTEFARLGSGVAFVYSDQDPWAAGAVTPDASSGNVRFDVTNGNHQATFSSLSEADQAALSAFLETNLGIDLP